MDGERPVDHQTPDSKEEQGTLAKVSSLAPLASVVIQLGRVDTWGEIKANSALYDT
jgi:hypothetical protein